MINWPQSWRLQRPPRVFDVEDHREKQSLDFTGTAKLPIAQWISLTAVGVTLAFNLSARFSASDRTANDLAKLQGDVAEMRKQMANRDDLKEMEQVVERLEIQVATLSDRLERRR
jgi:hypothetical protein